MTDGLTQPTRAHLPYAIGVGVLAALVYASVDLTAVALLGDVIPLRLLPLLLAGYVVLGGLGGCAVGLSAMLGRRLWPVRLHRVSGNPSGVQLATLILWTAVCCGAAVERLQHDWVTRFDADLAPGTLSALAIGMLIALIAAARGSRIELSANTFVWVVFWLALCCASWPAYNGLYQAPLLSPISILAKLVFLIAALIALLAGRWLLGQVRVPPWLSCGRCALQGAVVMGCLGLSTSALLVGATRRTPLNLTGEDLAATPAQPSEAHNVVMIVLDTVRNDHLSTAGYYKDTTPNLARLAEEAMRYDAAIAPSPFTLASHASFFTGLLPTEHGAHFYLRDRDDDESRITQPLAMEAVTLAEMLQSQGYETAAVCGNTIMLDRSFGLAQGFRFYDDRRRPSLQAASAETWLPSRWMTALLQRHIGFTRRRFRDAREINRDVGTFLAGSPRRPLFLFINYMDAHAPYRAHPEYDAQLWAEIGTIGLPTPYRPGRQASTRTRS